MTHVFPTYVPTSEKELAIRVMEKHGKEIAMQESPMLQEMRFNLLMRGARAEYARRLDHLLALGFTLENLPPGWFDMYEELVVISRRSLAQRPKHELTSHLETYEIHPLDPAQKPEPMQPVEVVTVALICGAGGAGLYGIYLFATVTLPAWAEAAAIGGAMGVGIAAAWVGKVVVLVGSVLLGWLFFKNGKSVKPEPPAESNRDFHQSARQSGPTNNFYFYQK